MLFITEQLHVSGASSRALLRPKRHQQEDELSSFVMAFPFLSSPISSLRVALASLLLTQKN